MKLFDDVVQRERFGINRGRGRSKLKGLKRIKDKRKARESHRVITTKIN